jgi:serine/threonine-protein kinase
MPEQVPAPLAAALRHRYTIQHELGRGGTAFVFLAHDLKHDRLVAIKVLRPEIAVLLGVERFLREIRFAAQLRHPNIMPLYDSGEAGGSLYYVMPYVAGQSLRQRLVRDGPLPFDDAIGITHDACDALSYAHGQDIVHRDIKPENILLDAGHALVADFGLARAIAAAGGEKLSETGMTVGTPAYMSPEQAGAVSRIDGRSDVYSLGCVLYEMLAGAPPFTGPSAQALLARHALDPVPPLRTVRKAVPEQVERVVMKALQKVPADRFSTAGEFAAALAQPVRPGRPRRTHAIAAVAVGALIMAGAWWGIHAAGARSAPIHRLAVLPLENLTGDTAQEYFVEGMHEALVTELAKIGALSVISRTSVLGYRHTSKTISEIARELQVDAVVEGSVVLAGDSVRITAQLIAGPTNRHLWADTYVRNRRQVLALYADVTQAIAREVRAAVTPEERARLTKTRTVDPEANDLYLKGHYLCDKWTEVDMTRGIAYYRRAIDQDPTFAPAYAGLAGCYADFAFFSYGPPADFLPRAKAAIQRALALDSTFGEAYGALGWIRLVTDFDFSGPDRDFRRALELSPGSAPIRLNYGDYLAIVGRFDEAIAQSLRAIELDPLSSSTSLNLGWVYFKARRYDESIAQLRQTLELDRSYWFAHMELAWNFLQKGLLEEAVAQCDSAVAGARDAHQSGVVGNCGWVYGRAGRRKQALGILRQLTANSDRAWQDPIDVALVYVGLGERDRALEWLQRSARERLPTLVFLKVEPGLDPLRSDPRFKALLRELGIES